MDPFVSLIIPAYNEEKNVGTTVRNARRFFREQNFSYEIIVVNDGSTDVTGQEIERLMTEDPSTIGVSYQQNKGKGYAVRKGMLAARGSFVAYSDADGSTPIEELKNLFAAFEQSYDIVIGSRYVKESSVIIRQPWYRILIGRLGNFLIRKTLLPDIWDTQCGFKAMRREAAHAIFQRQTIDRWGFDMEILIIGKLLGCSIIEVPVRWHNSTTRRSRFRPIRDAHRTLRDLVRIKKNLLQGKYNRNDF